MVRYTFLNHLEQLQAIVTGKAFLDKYAHFFFAFDVCDSFRTGVEFEWPDRREEKAVVGTIFLDTNNKASYHIWPVQFLLPLSITIITSITSNTVPSDNRPDTVRLTRAILRMA